MTYQEIIDLAEQQGWSVRETIEEQPNRHLFEFSQESPAGEDFSFTVDGETPESLIHEVYMFAEDFDADEHADMWIHAKESGTAGVPSTRTIVEDSEAIQKMLDELSEMLSNAAKIKSLNQAYQESEEDPLCFHYWCNALGEINPLDNPQRAGNLTDLPSGVRAIYEGYCCDRGGVNNYVVTVDHMPGIALCWLFLTEDEEIKIAGIKKAAIAMIEKIPYGVVYVGENTDPEGHELLLFIPQEFIEVFNETIRRYEILHGENSFGDRYYDLAYGKNQEDSCDEYEDRWFADTRWHVDDVIGVAAEHGVTLTREQAAQWWEVNQRWFHERLAELGNDMLSCVDWDSAICSKCGRVIEPDEIPYTHNGKTDRECTVCDECHDAMWESNQITHCEFCGCWYDTSMLKSDPELVGGDTFTPCPGCGHDIVDGMTRSGRMLEAQQDETPKTPQYAVTFRYTFDKNGATYLFLDEGSAKKFLRDNYDCVVKEIIETKHSIPSHSIAEDGWYAKIIEHFSDHDDVTEMFLNPIYQ